LNTPAFSPVEIQFGTPRTATSSSSAARSVTSDHSSTFPGTSAAAGVAWAPSC
jgi:hypothetical protein